MSASMTSCLCRAKFFVCGFLCLSLMWFKAYAVDPISWQLPPQDIAVSDALLMRHNFDMNNLGQAAVIYSDPSEYVRIAIKDKEGAWIQTLLELVDDHLCFSFSLNIGINDQSDLLAVWDRGGGILKYATANFNDLMLGGSWTISSVPIAGISAIQSFDFNNAGKAIIFRSTPGTPHVFNGTDWDNTDNTVTFGTAYRPTAAINDSGEIIAIWSDGDPGPLRYETRTVGGSWDIAEAKTITTANILKTTQTLSLNNSGQAVASWASWVDSTSGIMRIATFTFGDASWTVLSEASTVSLFSIRALINDNGQIISSWYDDGSDLQVRTGPFATPLANGTQLSTKFGYVGALRDDGIAAFILTDNVSGWGTHTPYGPISAITFDASDLSFSAKTLLSGVNDVEVFFSQTFFFKTVTNNGGDWLALWIRNSDQMLQTSYSYSPPSPPTPFFTILSAGGKQVTARFATCKEYVNCLYWSVSTNESLSFYRIYRDDNLISTVGASQVLEFDDREQKKLPNRYTIEAINQGGGISATTTIVVP